MSVAPAESMHRGELPGGMLGRLLPTYRPSMSLRVEDVNERLRPGFVSERLQSSLVNDRLQSYNVNERLHQRSSWRFAHQEPWAPSSARAGGS